MPPATTPMTPTTPLRTIAPILSSAPFSPAALEEEDAATLEAELATLPDEADPLMLLAAAERDETTDEMEAEAEAPVELAMAAEPVAIPEGSWVLPVAEERRTETEPEADWTPQRAAWSWTDCCCSAAVQLLRNQPRSSRRI